MRSLLKLLACSTAVTLAACAPVDILNKLTPSKTFNLSENIQYGDLDAHKLDVYAPATNPKADSPVIVFIYGGSWNSGNKDMYKFVGEAFASNGYTAVVPNYRLYPDVIYPEFAVDAAKAVAWTRETYDRPIVLIGHSAGAHISSLLALDDSYLPAQNVKRCEVLAGWIGLAGPYDFKVYDPPFTEIFPKEKRPQYLPITYAPSSVAPALLSIGKADTTVSPAQTERMETAIRKTGTPVTAKFYDGVNHTDIVAHMANFFKDKSPTQSDVMEFIASLPAPSCAQ